MKEATKKKKDSSPRATGPAGSQFEAKVATHYALGLLAQTEAFGLPGAIVDRLEFQRSGQGHPLDDIIVKATTRTGDQRCLEVQAKRSMAFTKGDSNFAAVVASIVASRKADPNRRFAVAIERTSGPIENGVQEALELSRSATDAKSFFKLLRTPGRGNEEMRNFVAALKSHLATHGCGNDEVVFAVLKSLSVLVFDFARPNSIAEHHDRTRAKQLATGANQDSLYEVLFGLILRSDAIGGETNREHLKAALGEHNIEIGPSRNLAKARERIEEVSRFALRDINTTVSRQQLARVRRRRQLEELLAEAEPVARVVEITGPGGAGKSGLLKSAAEGRNMLSRVLVLAPDRTPSGGWPALRSELQIDATAQQFLEDLSCDGGGLVCIDGLDRFRNDGQLKTVIDVISSALDVPGVTVLFTARTGWQEQAALAFGEELMASLKTPRQLYVEGLDDAEAVDLAASEPALAPLLRPDHPAKALARNPFILQRLLSTPLKTDQVWTEAELAWTWWTSGAYVVGGAAGDTHARRRVLLSVAQGLLEGQALINVATQDAAAVATLIADDVLVQIATDRVKFVHDLFVDWAIACALAEDQQRMDLLPLDVMPPFWLSRGFELACRRLAEGNDKDAWPALVKDLECRNAKSGWAALALLALVRSEQARTLLIRHADLLLEGKGERAASLIRRVIASHGQPAEAVLKKVLPPGVTIPKGLILPAGPQWPVLIVWCLDQIDQLPPAALAAAISLFEAWLTLAAFGEKTISPLLLERLADVLVAEMEEQDRVLAKPGEVQPKVKYAVGRDALKTARLQLALYAESSPSAAARYLSAIATSKQPSRRMLPLLKIPGKLASAAPATFCEALLNCLIRDHEENSKSNRGYPAPTMLESPFVLGRCGIRLFADLLAADRKSTLELIRSLVALNKGPTKSDPKFVLPLAGRDRAITQVCSYGWSRGNSPSTIATMALKALEFSAHERIEAGERLDEIVGEFLGDGPVSGALLLVIVDLVLSHSSLDGRLLAELVASTELLTLDATRAVRDQADAMAGGKLGLFRKSALSTDAAIEQSLAECKSRTLALHDVISQIVLRQPDAATADLRSKLAAAVTRLGPWKDASIDWTSEQFMASHAHRLASKESYEPVTKTNDDGIVHEGWSFRWPEDQARWSKEQTSGLAARNTAFTRSLALRMAMDDAQNPVTVSVADAEAVLLETAEAAPRQIGDEHDPNDPWLARVAAAAFLARFASDEALASQEATWSAIFDRALQQTNSELRNLSYDVMYDSTALAIAGRVYLAARLQRAKDWHALLSAVNGAPASAAAAFAHHPQAAKDIGDQPLRSSIRIGLQACEFPRRKDYNEDQETFDTRRMRLIATQSTRLTAELDWLEQGGNEPKWPSPPLRRQRRPKRSIYVPGGPPKPHRARREPKWPDTYFDDRTAALWLRTLEKTTDSGAIRTLLDANRDWLIDANGRGDGYDDDTDLERTWTCALFECAATRAKSWTDAERDALLFDVLDEFSDEAFIESAAAFLVKSDLMHIEGDAAATQYLVGLRTRLWARLKTTLPWQRHCRSPRDGLEIHLNEVVLAFFCKISGGFGRHTSYTKGLTDDQIVPFLPVLTEMAVTSAPCPTIARLLLDLLELIDPHEAQPYLLIAAVSWLAGGDQRFWNELGIGERVCALVEKADVQASAHQWMEIADAIASTGVVAGETLKQALRKQ